MDQALQTPSFWKRLNYRRRVLLYAFHYLAMGLFFSALGGQSLVSERSPASPWLKPLNFAMLCGWLWVALRGPELLDISSRDPKQEREETLGCMGMIIIVLLIVLSNYAWAVGIGGVAMAALFWSVGQVRGRVLIVAAAGWLVGAYLALRTDWPGDQRFLLMWVIGGLGIALQGILEIPHNISMVRAHRAQRTYRPEKRNDNG